MTRFRLILTAILLLFLALGLAWLDRNSVPLATPEAAHTSASNPKSFRLGLIPERDIFKQRHAYRALGDYLEPKLGCPVELVTNASYEGVLKDFENRQVDAAFLGSLVAALAVDRYQARIVLKSETKDFVSISTYAGVIFVPPNSPIQSVADLRGKTLGAVATTTAGAVFPVYLMEQSRLPEDGRPKIVWSGTHDDVIREVVAGRLDAGAVKDLRLDAYEREHPTMKFRRLAASSRVPDNALVVRADLPPEFSEKLRLALLLISDDPHGNGPKILSELDVLRFLPASIDEYAALYDMLDVVGAKWPLVGIDGPRPKRPFGFASTTRSIGIE